MRVVTSLVCAWAIATSAGCGDTGSGNGEEEAGGTASQAGASSGNTAGNTTSSAGASSSGNTAGNATSSAGTSSAGTSSSGNTAGNTTSSAGMSSVGGATGGGATGGGASAVTPVYTFDTDTQGFKIQDSSAAAGVDPVLKADVMSSFNAADGSPNPGSLQLDIPYTAASQYVSTGVNIAPPGVNLTGKTLKAMVKIASGYGSAADLMTAPGNAKLYIKTGATYVYASGPVANITSIGTWTAVDFNTAAPAYSADMAAYDPTQVLEIGIQFDTNSGSTTAAPAVVLVDSISY